MSTRYGLTLTLALGALVALAGLVADGRPWGADDAPAPSGPTLIPALMLGLLAAVLATRGRGRTIVGGVMAALTFAVGIDTLRALIEIPSQRDPLLVAAVTTIALGGPATSIAVAWLGRRWAGLGERYERTRTTGDEGGALQMWRDLDAGVDPTER